MNGPVSIADQVACIERELRLREKVYPRWVRTCKLTQPAADLELLRLRAVLATLQGIEPALALAVEGERERVLKTLNRFMPSNVFVRAAAAIRGGS